MQDGHRILSAPATTQISYANSLCLPSSSLATPMRQRLGIVENKVTRSASTLNDEGSTEARAVRIPSRAHDESI